MKNINNLFLLFAALFLSNCSAHASGDLSDSSAKVFSEKSISQAPCGKRTKYCKGAIDFKDGSSYKGEFRYGEPHGRGLYYWTDGETYEGEFVNGLIVDSYVKVKISSDKVHMFLKHSVESLCVTQLVGVA